VVLRLKRRNPSHQFVDGNSECPYIDKFVIPTALEHFRSSVVRSSGECEHISFDAPFGQLPTDPKIDENDSLSGLVIQNVLRFDIPVANFLGVDIGQSFQELVTDFFKFLNRR